MEMAPEALSEYQHFKLLNTGMLSYVEVMMARQLRRYAIREP